MSGFRGIVPELFAVITTALFCVVFVMFLWLYVKDTKSNLENFKQQCTSVGGKAVFNGKHWECFK